MFGPQYAAKLINRSASNEANRRSFQKAASLTGLGVIGAGALGTGVANASPEAASAAAAIDDPTILNFALNLEYLEAEFYSWGTHGHGLAANLKTGTGTQGATTGGHKVPFKSAQTANIFGEISDDEIDHVNFLRTNLGNSKVAFPAIDLQKSFTKAAQAAGLITASQTFDPFASESNFYLAAFIFEDVGVTAYKGAAPLISSKTYLSAAAGILAAEAYHAATIRTQLLNLGLSSAADKISAARDSLDGTTDDDQGLTKDGFPNITPLDPMGIAYSRTPQQVLNVVYLTASKNVSKGGFFPAGLNGAVKTT